MHYDDETLEEQPYAGPHRRAADFTDPHCPEHSGNMEFFRSVKSRLNWCLSGVGLILAGMAWFYITLYTQNGVITKLTGDNQANTGKIGIIERDINTLQEQQKNTAEWQRMWEMKESIVHSGIERHVTKSKGSSGYP